MAFFRRTFSRRLLPDRFQEITERVYVFECCLSTKELPEQDYKAYMETAVSNIQRHHPGASFMVFNFKEGDDPSLLSEILSHHDMTVVDYPRHYEGYPILPLEMIHYFLRSSDSWLSLEGQRNVILMHCERGGWPALAFMLAGLLLYTKKQFGEMKALDLVLKNSPKELWMPLSLMNPRPSQLRYLNYISGRSLTSDWPPTDAALLIESVLLMDVPLFHGGKGCRPVIHVYCQDPSVKSNTRPRLLCSSLMSEDGTHFSNKEECMLVKINLNCRVQGDVFIECIHLGDDLVSEEKIFKVMFHTAFVQSYTMVLGSTEVDVLSNANCKIPDDFKVEVKFHNPEEVQLSIAKAMASLESGYESESEFFEAEEFDITVSQDHNGDNLVSKEITNITTEDTDHSEDRPEELDFSSFKSIAPEDDIHSLEKQNSFGNKPQNQQIIEEAIVIQHKNPEQVFEVEYVPILYPSDENNSHPATEIDLNPSVKGNYILYDDEENIGSEKVTEITGSNVQDTKQSDVVERSKEYGSDIASSLIEYEASKDLVEVEETTNGGSTSASLEEIFNNAMKSVILLEKNQEDSSTAPVDAEFSEIEDSSPLEPIIECKSISILQEVVNEESEDGSEIVIQESSSEETPNWSESAVLLGGSQETTQASCSLELNLAEKSIVAVQDSSRTGSNSNLEVEEGSDSEICSSEIEYENCTMSKSFTSIEGSEDSSEAAYSHTGSESFLVAQATSPEPSNASKHIVVVVEDSYEHEVKVQVQTKEAGSRGVQQRPKSKKKPMRLADAVAKVTMQKRVVSMWVPRDKQLTSDDVKNRASVYKWVPKESGSTSEEASKQGN